jgi:hypothetical protein
MGSILKSIKNFFLNEEFELINCNRENIEIIRGINTIIIKKFQLNFIKFDKIAIYCRKLVSDINFNNFLIELSDQIYLFICFSNRNLTDPNKINSSKSFHLEPLPLNLPDVKIDMKTNELLLNDNLSVYRFNSINACLNENFVRMVIQNKGLIYLTKGNLFIAIEESNEVLTNLLTSLGHKASGELQKLTKNNLQRPKSSQLTQMFLPNLIFQKSLIEFQTIYDSLNKNFYPLFI